MKVLFLPEVEDYLFELIEILYHKEYFGFKESAISYVVDLENDIKNLLPNKVKRPAPTYFDKFGKKLLYAVFEKKQPNTMVCIFQCLSGERRTNSFISPTYFQ
jgi:hypothetical protein